jgi:hypothetical protein
MSTKTQTEPPDTPGNVSAWTRMLWDAEAKYTATVGSRLKFGLPLSPAKPKRARAKAGKRAAVKG